MYVCMIEVMKELGSLFDLKDKRKEGDLYNISIVQVRKRIIYVQADLLKIAGWCQILP